MRGCAVRARDIGLVVDDQTEQRQFLHGEYHASVKLPSYSPSTTYQHGVFAEESASERAHQQHLSATARGESRL